MLFRSITKRLSVPQDFEGVGVLITAGATREPLDPVRFLSNRSSGKMGFALAEEAARRGARVLVIAGFTTATSPPGVTLLHAETAEQMKSLCLAQSREFDVFIGAAAVADYAPAEISEQKIKKGSDTETEITLRLVKTPDVLAAIAAQKQDGQFVVGFAAETENLLTNAQEKLKRKGLDMIVANDVTAEGAGFDTDTNIVTFLFPQDETHSNQQSEPHSKQQSEPQSKPQSLPKMSKKDVAHEILNAIRSRIRHDF